MSTFLDVLGWIGIILVSAAIAVLITAWIFDL